ncbi:hypothetical protein [Saccharopolyspora taberi]|uniref:DUF8129 domain-containing protein n=1 Tax=Saccharopolyspora taberi TaxID=60895 RepID=A0ABN3VEW0_9PSEU
MAEKRLPLPDYDELPVGVLRYRIRSLDADALGVLLDHEKGHADRALVEELITNRLHELEQGARPSPGSPADIPEARRHARSGSPVTPGSGRQPSGPPARHGVIGEQGRPKPN